MKRRPILCAKRVWTYNEAGDDWGIPGEAVVWLRPDGWWFNTVKREEVGPHKTRTAAMRAAVQKLPRKP